MMTMSRKDTDPIVSYILCLAMILSIFGSFFAPVEVFAMTGNTQIADLSDWVTVTDGKVVVDFGDDGDPNNDDTLFLVKEIGDQVADYNDIKEAPVATSTASFAALDFSYVEVDSDDDFHEGSFERQYRHGTKILVATVDLNVSEAATSRVAIAGVHAFEINVDVEVDFGGEEFIAWNREDDLLITTPATITINTPSSIFNGVLTIAADTLITSSGCTVSAADVNGALVITGNAIATISGIDFKTEADIEKGVIVVNTTKYVVLDKNVTFDNEAVDIYFEDDVNIYFEENITGKAVIKYGGRALATEDEVSFSVPEMDDELLYYFELVDDPFDATDNNYKVMYSEYGGYFYITPHVHNWEASSPNPAENGVLYVECLTDDCKYNINRIKMQIVAEDGLCGEEYVDYKILASEELSDKDYESLKIDRFFYVRDNVNQLSPIDYTPTTHGMYSVSLKIGENRPEAFAWFNIEHKTDITSYSATHHWTECSVDGSTSSAMVEHAMNAWAHDSENHWKVCTGCAYEAKDTATSHDAIQNVTKPGISTGHVEYCGTCGYESGVHTHTLVAKHNPGDDYHWKECTGCNYKTTTEAHIYTVDGYTDTDHWKECNVCQAVDETTLASHPALTMRFTTTHHELWCEECNYVTGNAAHVARHDLTSDAATHWYACTTSECKYRTSEAAHTYTFKFDQDKHWYECTCGATSGTAIHDFEDHKWSAGEGHWDECDHDSCGVTRAAVVELQKTYNSTAHWYKCPEVGCGYTENYVNHTTTYAAVETTGHVIYCTDSCGYVSGTIPHTYAHEMVKSDDGHSEVCTGCGFVTDKVSHASFVIACDAEHHWYQCSEARCGWRNQNTYEPHIAGVLTSDTATHWNKCTYGACEGVKVNEEEHAYVHIGLDSSGHWMECLCGARKGFEDHEFEYVTDADNHSKKCQVATCGYVLYEGPHTFSCDWDVNGHWYVCSGCPTVVPAVAHVRSEDFAIDNSSHWRECTAEGCQVRLDVTSHSALRQWNENGHWDLCTQCGVTYGATGHSIVLTTDAGCHWESCEDCGYETSHVTHSAVILISTDAAYHWHVCETCGTATDPVAHNHNVLQKDDAQHWYKCFACLNETERVDHTSTYAIKMTADNHWYECTVCGDTTTPEAHNFKATGFDTEKHWDVCQTTGCGVTRNAITHDLQLATNGSFHWNYCTNVDCEYKTDDVAHDFTTVTYGALSNGDLGHWNVCTYCAVTTNAAAHVLDLVATDAGFHWKECAGCDYETTHEGHNLTTVAIDDNVHHDVCQTSYCAFTTNAAAHVTSAWITVTPAQIGVVGYKHTICTGCGVELELATIPALTPAPAGGGGGGASVEYYDVTAEKTENGTFKVSVKTSAEGEEIKITATPNEGYEVGTVTVKDADNKTVAVTKNADGTYTFKMPASDVKIDVDFAKELGFDQYVSDYADCKTDASCPMHGYHDVNLESWYHNGVHFCLDNDLMVGYGDGEFRPNSILSRSMITSMLWKLAGSPVAAGDVAFDDVEAGKWYEPSIRWAASMGIVSGYTNGDFGPNDALTREQMVTVLWNFAKKMGYDVSVGEETNILSYDDVAQVAEYAIPAFQWACGAGLVSGKPNADNTGFVLDPTGSGTRAQIAAVMMNFIEYYK